MAVSIILATGTKANALVYVVFVIICTLVGRLIYGKKQRIMEYALFCLIVGLIAVFGICYHPYVTNWLNNGHPLFPLLGGTADIMTYNTPEELLHHNRFVNFVISVFSISLPSVDQRLGGFTPLFVVLLPLALVSIGYCYVKAKYFMSWFGYIAICIIASCFLFEQSWWARYIPQLWLLVPLSVYTLILFPINRTMKLVRYMIIVLVVTSGVVYSLTMVYGVLYHTIHMSNMLKVHEGCTLPIAKCQPHAVRMLHEHKIKVNEYDWECLTESQKDSVMSFVMIYDNEWSKVLIPSRQLELDSLLQSNKLYRWGANIRRIMGKEENVSL